MIFSRLTATLLVVLALGVGPATAAAKKKPGLLPYAGSYTGQAVSTTSLAALASSSTLTFTGKKLGMRGTFLYTGILNQAGVAQSVVQTFNLTSKGVVNGRVTVGALNGTGSGQATLVKRTLRFSMTYSLSDGMNPIPTTVQITGTAVFHGHRVKLQAQVSSSDPGFNGTLLVTGKR